MDWIRKGIGLYDEDLVYKVYSLFRDSRGNIWVGGMDANLAVIDKQDNISYYPIQQIKSIYQSKDGHILTTGRFFFFW
ncbi:hypothetical protein E1J38_008000 [Seonamhaeicola sediminis]|uniref:Uncharacterized protein n=1 Tax=Seonamhaeicola sediminis TaxID=2528206 RepID=A0A562YDY5_9FLAO|nr:two-component regulator propeller domain-containing protein [Seonamhaeicola sediminis]TWO32800.1 hypothetical protein E1J38_008000 [Seonamhaeicola sediminis]